MLAGGLDQTYRDALPFGHEPFLQVEILDGLGNVLDPDLEFATGSVNATLLSRVSRTLTLTTREDFYPYENDGLLAPYGNMVRAWRGVRFANGDVRKFPVFVGRIQNTSLVEPGQTQIVATDLAQEVVDAQFFEPHNSHAGSSVEAEVKDLISDAWPSAMFGTFDTDRIPVRSMTWQLDRGQALDELATSVSAYWYALADGKFVLRRYPWTVPAAPVVTYSDADPGGTIEFSYPHRNRADVYNSLTVTGERLNGDEAVYETAQDLNELSPTYVNGTFGRRHQLLRLQTPGSQSAVRSAAESNLSRMIGLVEAWSWTMVVDSALELGDVVLLEARGRSSVQVVESMIVPLDFSAPMTVHGRAQVLDAVEGVS